MRVALLGFGLIGGSIARALRRAGGDWTVAGWSPSGNSTRQARSEGVLDEASPSPRDAIDGANLVVLAAPPLATLALIDGLGRGEMAASMGRDVVVTDVAGTKDQIGRRADEAGLRFVGGHPMAGRELTGYGASSADLFDGRPWVVVPGVHAGPDDRGRVEALAIACRARPIEMSAADHDVAVAGISHLPLVLAAALVEAVAGTGDGAARPGWDAAAGLAASGWQGMTRLARGDVEMGSGMLTTNGPAIAARVRDLRGVLDWWLVELERDRGPDADAIASKLAAARRRLEDAE